MPQLHQNTMSTKTHRSFKNGRLVWYSSAAGPDFWKNHWIDHFNEFKPHYPEYEKGFLHKHETLFTTWLPKDGKVVEAGCGLSQYVLGLKARGYDVEGIDFDQNTVEMVRELFPDLPIWQADARNMDVPDNHYSGYISLGVIEHLPEGPDAFIKEAYRVLKPGGRAIFTVPWFNPFRKMKARCGAYSRKASQIEFYQYAFSKKELLERIAGQGFAIRDVSSTSTLKGLRDEMPFARKLLAHGHLGPRLNSLINRADNASPIMGSTFGHMIAVVAEKPDGPQAAQAIPRSNFDKVMDCARNAVSTTVHALNAVKQRICPVQEETSASPFGDSPRGSREEYLALHAEARKNEFPRIDNLERRFGAAIDREWMEQLALHTQVVIKKSKLNYHHGRILYSILKNYVQDKPEKETVVVLETGTARGFSALCMARALEDGSQNGYIITVDSLPHMTPMYWNCIDDHNGPNTRQDLLMGNADLLPKVTFVQGRTDEVLPTLGIKRVHMAFLDAAHTEDAVLEEYRYVEPRQAPGDIIVFDDVTPELFPGVCKAVEAIESEGKYDVERIQVSAQRGYAVARHR